YIGELNDRIVKRAKSHKPAAIRDLQSRRVYVDDESSNLFAFFSADHLRRRARHHDQHARLYAVRAPEFFAVQNEFGAVFAWLGCEAQCGRVGSCMDLRQCERRNFAACGAILGGLCWVRVNSIEIVTSNKQVAGETASVLERIARGLGKLERLALAFAHF